MRMYSRAPSVYSARGLPWILGPNTMLSHTVSQGNSAGSWNTTARSGPGASTGAPNTSTAPALAGSNPATRFIRVDLPHPLGPRMAVKAPSSTIRSMPVNACTGLRPG